MSFDTPIPTYSASDPHASFLNSSCLDFLLIELVPLAQRLARELAISSSGRTGAGAEEGGGSADGAGGSSASVIGGAAETEEGLDEEEEREAMFYRLEMLGYRVGQGLAERYVSY